MSRFCIGDTISLLLLLLLMFSVQGAAAAELLAVDDSYTVSQRYAQYKPLDPALVWPVVEFMAGQKILFERRYRQIGSRELHLDVFLPATTSKANRAIILVHGGGWRSGQRSNFYPMANLLAQRGFAVITPEYRLSGEAAYPAGLVDLNYAILWVREHAAQLNIDPAKISLGGGSSGGHMAALLAYTCDQGLYKSAIENADTCVNAIVDMDGVLDFTNALSLASENKKADKSAAALWLGGAYESIPDVWKQASSVQHISASSPPILVISSGQLRFTSGKDQLFSQLDQYNIARQYHQFDNIIHTFWLFEPYLGQSVAMIDEFLRKH